MTKLIITRGISASLKTTAATAWVAVDPVHRARVNRDDIRAMVHDGVYVQRTKDTIGTEKLIIALRDAAIRTALDAGVDVICDDTNLKQRVACDLRRLATLAGAEFEVWDLTDAPLEECIRRDAAREGRAKVGEAVIREQYNRYLKGKKYPLPFPEEFIEGGIDSTHRIQYIPDITKPRAVMVDIDGTVALLAGRSPYDESRVLEDRPNTVIIEVIKAMRDSGRTLVFLSGRTSGCFDDTLKWLDIHVGGEFKGPIMRAIGDTRKDSIIKYELFNQHIRDLYNVEVAVDDRDQVVQLWRSLGLVCMQVEYGNF
jgi:predicted kinase